MNSRHTRYQARYTPRVRTLSFMLVSALALLIVAFSLALGTHTASAASASPRVDVMMLNTDIGPASLQFLTQSINTAESDGSQALVIEVDSPGGDITSMKAMVEAELNSTVPIIAYVSPPGAYAASAAAFVTLAAPVAAMAPTTRIGASSPINGNGSNLDSTLQKKIENDLVASITGIQKRYHRKGVDYAAAMVTQAKSYDTDTALKDGIVDLEASNLGDLLNKVNNSPITLYNGHTVTLHTAGASTQTLNPSVFDTLYGLLLDPNIVFLLFIVAMIGIYLEISHPGAILPGTVGGIALILFLFGVGSLSPNWAGLALMVLAFVLLVLDLRLPTHGILTIGAVISLILGALILFNTGGPYSGPQVNPIVVYIMGGFVGLLSFALISIIVRVQRRPVTTGREGMIGAKAIALTSLAPEGRVSYGGENWAAVLDDPNASVDAGSQVQIVAVQGLRLLVQPVRSEIIQSTYSDPPLKYE